MKLESVGVLLLAAGVASSCGEEMRAPVTELAPVEVGATHQTARSTNKVLILASSVSESDGGRNSREARAVTNLDASTEIDIVTPSQWRRMTAEQFMEYRALIIGDADCESGTDAFQAAIETRNNWGAIVDGNVVILSTDPSTNGTPRLVENALTAVLDSAQGLTGMYISLGCAYQSAPANTQVMLLAPFGTFRVQGMAECAPTGHMFRMHPPMLSAGISDGQLPGNGCAARSVFTTYPEHTFAAAAIATGPEEAPIPGQRPYIDYLIEEEVETPFTGTPYILMRGAMAMGAGCGGNSDYIPPDQQCDMGENLNGQPARPGQDPIDTCSYSCRFNWCGDGQVDAAFGEECDEGANNGRTSDASGNIGNCTSFCQIPRVNRPPVALCRSVTVAATATCGLPADINNGSSDPDNNLAGCTQSPAGPFPIGSTTVTLTCRDEADLVSRCTGIVTVEDQVMPEVTLNGPASEGIECTRTGSYRDQGATASDMCQGSVPVTVSGAVNPAAPGAYVLEYSATDSGGNVATATRTVSVADTLAPRIAVSGSNRMEHQCGTPFLDPGATADDVCAGTLPVSATRSGSADQPGTFSITYSAADPSGNRSTSTGARTVTVVDDTPPTLTLAGPATQTLECGTPFAEPGATASDLCAGDLTARIIRTGAVNPAVLGSYTLTYSVSDPSNNTVTRTRKVNVADTQPPSIVCPDPIVVETREGALVTVTLGAARATDTCSQVRISSPTQTRFPLGNTPVTYTATDAAGNSASCTSSVSVVEFALPDTWIVNGPPRETQATEATFDFNASKPNVTYECSVDGKDFQDCLATSTFSGLTEGDHTLEVRARDSAGNVDPTPASTIWTVVPPSRLLDRALMGGGNGCSSTGSGPASLAMVGLAVLAGLLGRKRVRPGLLLLPVLLLGAKASAQVEGIPTFELELLQLNPNGKGSLLLGSGELLPHGDYRFSLTAHYQKDPLILYQDGAEVGTVVRHRATTHLTAAYGLWGRLELGAQVPLVLLQRGDDLTSLGVGRPHGGLAAGTPLFTFQMKLLSQREDDLVDLALGVQAGPPIGSAAALAREVRATPSLMAGHTFKSLRAAVDAGLLLRPRTVLTPDANVQDELGHAVRLGGALSSLGQGLRGELSVIGLVPLKRQGFSVEALSGVRWPMSDAVEAYGLAGVGFGSAPGTPDFRVLFGVAYDRPRPARVELAKYEPPEDSDRDGILDDLDRCPNVPGLPGLQGCPDRDGDSLEDEVDHCPSEPGPVARQGCPEKDSDGDSLMDEEDACPTEPGPRERQGCPIRDRDQDTVEDMRDNCPDEAGPVENEGCPAEEKQLVVIQTDRIAIKDKVHFDFDKATIQPRSFGLLDQVARVLREHPEILTVSINGHTDSQGPADYNRNLSQRRAESVREYLIQKGGIAPERLQAQGFGEDQPIETNATNAGRAANRRVEFLTRYGEDKQ
ncbi:MAG TPA: immunoglobulin-like domain-containing protein [Hyalangium sp.]|nr:immunoglobulin-like domain-containing protein [Hyalangium sp.]